MLGTGCIVPIGNMSLEETHRSRIYLKKKFQGENSMFEKESRQAVEIPRRKSCKPALDYDLIDTVKAILPESQFLWGLIRASRLPRLLAGLMSRMMSERHHLTSIHQPISYALGKGTNRKPNSIYNVQSVANMGSPKGREPYGDGKPIVVPKEICER